MGREHRNIIIIFLLIVITICIIFISIVFIKPDTNSPIELIGITISSIIGVLSLFFVITEYRRARNIEEGQFIFNLNNES